MLVIGEMFIKIGGSLFSVAGDQTKGPTWCRRGRGNCRGSCSLSGFHPCALQQGQFITVIGPLHGEMGSFTIEIFPEERPWGCPRDTFRC